VLDTFDGLERYRGFFYNFYDTTSLERTSNFISFVDAAWLLAGLVVLRNAIPELAEHATRFIDGQDFGLFYDKKLRQIWHGYWVHEKHPSIFHYGIFYSEARLGALLAIGKGDVPAAAWHNMVRVPPPLCGNTMPGVTASLITEPSGDPDSANGYYQWKDVRYLPSWGGSMFEALMPVLLIDEVVLSPDGLGRNDILHARVQQRYATEELGYEVWGMSPCSTVDTPLLHGVRRAAPRCARIPGRRGDAACRGACSRGHAGRGRARPQAHGRALRRLRRLRFLRRARPRAAAVSYIPTSRSTRR
jgi:hypothetical protein